MRDRTKIVALAVVTVPLALWAVLSGGGGQAGAGSGTAAARPVPASQGQASQGQASQGRATGGPSSGAASPSGSARPSPSGSASGSPSSGPSARAGDPPVVQHGSGTIVPVAGSTAASGLGRVRRYTVAVEAGLGIDADDFARQVDRTLADPRSWGHTGAIAFQRVDHGPADVHVVLASPDTADRLCRPLDTAGIYSCGNAGTAVINEMRWLTGADAYAGRLPEYRQYVVNHEVGHTIGHGHEQCGGPGRLAPVMMQQTKGVGACLPSPWPFP